MLLHFLHFLFLVLLKLFITFSYPVLFFLCSCATLAEEISQSLFFVCPKKRSIAFFRSRVDIGLSREFRNSWRFLWLLFFFWSLFFDCTVISHSSTIVSPVLQFCHFLFKCLHPLHLILLEILVTLSHLFLFFLRVNTGLTKDILHTLFLIGTKPYVYFVDQSISTFFVIVVVVVIILEERSIWWRRFLCFIIAILEERSIGWG
mmetsp:Transcript_39691/g.55974  ORF Transcript_39691/g.55974 Transcript_39691/m.55974 type:complete len:204 (-) Transcript_39691:1173-1784(-)